MIRATGRLMTHDDVTRAQPVTRLGVIPRTTARLEHWMAAVPWVAALYASVYEDVIRDEVALAEIDAEDRVLNVGCGPTPFTALLLARATGAQVTGIDRDPRAVSRAHRLVARCGLERRVRILLGDASAQLPPFDVAVLALQVTPKQPVLAALADRAAPEARLIVRLPAAWCAHMYDALPALLTPVAEARHNKGAFDRSALFRADDVREALRKAGSS